MSIADILSAIFAYGLLRMRGVEGRSGWRWLFILEGIPSVISSVFVWFLLPDYPETASWLTSEEKEMARRRLVDQGSHGSGNSLTWKEAKETLLEWRLWVHYIVSVRPNL